MKKNNQGFVFIETIIVVSILTITMLLLFASYSFIVRKFKERNTFDTTEAIYKTYYTKSIIDSFKPTSDSRSGVKYYIDTHLGTYNVCQQMGSFGSYVCNPSKDPSLSQLVNAFEVEKFYYVNLSNLFRDTKKDDWLYLFDATTIDYINNKGGALNAYILIVKFKKHYNKDDGTYEVLHSSMEV